MTTDFLEGTRRYPALRLATCVGVAAVASRREGLLFRALVGTLSSRYPSEAEVPLANVLYPGRVFVREEVTGRLPHSAGLGGGSRWPVSRYLRVSCRAALGELTDEREYTAAFDRYEFLRGMLEIAYADVIRAALGEFVTRTGTRQAIPAPDEITDGWPLIEAGAFDGAPGARDVYAKLTEQISRGLSV